MINLSKIGTQIYESCKSQTNLSKIKAKISYKNPIIRPGNGIARQYNNADRAHWAIFLNLPFLGMGVGKMSEEGPLGIACALYGACVAYRIMKIALNYTQITRKLQPEFNKILERSELIKEANRKNAIKRIVESLAQAAAEKEQAAVKM